MPRKELFNALAKEGLVIHGKDPEMVLITMLWRESDTIVRLPRTDTGLRIRLISRRNTIQILTLCLVLHQPSRKERSMTETRTKTIPTTSRSSSLSMQLSWYCPKASC